MIVETEVLTICVAILSGRVPTPMLMAKAALDIRNITMSIRAQTRTSIAASGRRRFKFYQPA
jgi:hypothetical protein